MKVCDGHKNEHTALKRLGGNFTGQKKKKKKKKKGGGGAPHWTVSQKFIIIDIRTPSLKQKKKIFI